jgi:predicted DNA-binding protein
VKKPWKPGRKSKVSGQVNPFPLRMPDDMRAKLTAWAKEDRRPLNNYLLTILEAFIKSKESPPD